MFETEINKRLRSQLVFHMLQPRIGDSARLYSLLLLYTNMHAIILRVYDDFGFYRDEVIT